MPLVTVQTSPVEEMGDVPVTLAEAKEQCRLVNVPYDTTHDTRLTNLIARSVASIERHTGAMLWQRTVRLDLAGFPDGDIDLMVYPVNSIDSVAYDDADGNTQTLTVTDDYFVQLGGMYPTLKAVSVWPVTQTNNPTSVRITMQAGYSAASLVPADLKQAVLMRVKEFFDNSGESITGQSVEGTVNSVKVLTDIWRRITQ